MTLDPGTHTLKTYSTSSMIPACTVRTALEGCRAEYLVGYTESTPSSMLLTMAYYDAGTGSYSASSLQSSTYLSLEKTFQSFQICCFSWSGGRVGGRATYPSLFSHFLFISS